MNLTSLTFNWPDYRKVSFALPGFILLSALVHGGAFMLFQAAYPPIDSLIAPPATVTLLTPSTLENRAQLRWVDAGDPALASKPQEIVPAQLLSIEYRPSYAEVNTEPGIGVPSEPGVGVPSEPGVGSPASAGMGLPSGVEPGAIPSIVDCQSLLARLARGNSRPIPSKSLAPATTIRLSGQLANRPPASQWATGNLAQTSARTLESAQFLVGVNAQGGVAYQFLQQSSGDPQLDRSVSRLIGSTQFASGSQPAWGMITFYWGPGIYAAKAPENPPPAQP